MQRSPLHAARESDSRGRRDINGRHAGGSPCDDRRGRWDEQRPAGVQTPTCDSVHRGESAAGASARGAQCPRAHEPLPFRATLQAKRRRAPASIPGSVPDRRGANGTGDSNGADRRDRAVSGISDAESLHDDVSTGHRDDAERVPQRGRRRQCREYLRCVHGWCLRRHPRCCHWGSRNRASRGTRVARQSRRQHLPPRKEPLVSRVEAETLVERHQPRLIVRTDRTKTHAPLRSMTVCSSSLGYPSGFAARILAAHESQWHQRSFSQECINPGEYVATSVPVRPSQRRLISNTAHGCFTGQTMTIAGQSSGMTDTRPRLEVPAWRESIVQGFMRVEDAVYAGLGTLLAAIALVLLVAVAVAFVRALLGATLPDHAVELLDVEKLH